jgi:DNA-binding MarR family transcriptional regulator
MGGTEQPASPGLEAHLGYWLRRVSNHVPGADELGLTRGAVPKVLDKFEGKQWIARRTLPDDNRVRLLSLTRQGERILPQLADITDRNDEGFFHCLDAKEQETLRRLLQKLPSSIRSRMCR